MNSTSYFIPLTFVFLTTIITGIFEIRDYYNKNLYLTVAGLILVAMWIISFVLTLSPDVDRQIYYIEIGLVTLAIITVLIASLVRWKKNEEAIGPYDKALSTNPNDVTALNNKGVELANQRKYEKAMQCFDRVLELDPEDPAVLHNKNFVEKYGTYRTVANYLEQGPKLKITSKDGKLILGVK